MNSFGMHKKVWLIKWEYLIDATLVMDESSESWKVVFFHLFNI